MFRAELQRRFSVLFPLRPPRRFMPSSLAPHWMERQDLRQGAFLSLISVTFSFWKGRSGKDRVCSAMVGGSHGEKPLGGSCGCFWSPQTSQEAVSPPTLCLESLLFPLSLLQSVETRVALPSSSGAGQMEKCRMGQSPSLFPAPGCTFPPAPSPGLLSPASPPPSQQPWHEGRSFLGSR